MDYKVSDHELYEAIQTIGQAMQERRIHFGMRADCSAGKWPLVRASVAKYDWVNHLPRNFSEERFTDALGKLEELCK